MPDNKSPDHPFPIHIDRQQVLVSETSMTGAQIRALPSPPVGPDRDLYLVVPGGQDIRVGDDQVVELKPGTHFVTAPKAVTPGDRIGASR